MAARDETTLVLGAGPAGLTAAYLLAKLRRPVLVVEAEEQVGGLSKTVVRDGYRFDLGGHRFFTKSPEVESLWLEILAEELLLRPRLSDTCSLSQPLTTASEEPTPATAASRFVSGSSASRGIGYWRPASGSKQRRQRAS